MYFFNSVSFYLRLYFFRSVTSGLRYPTPPVC